MKSLFVICSLIVVICSCKKEIAFAPPTPPTQYEIDLKILNEKFLIPEKEYMMTRHWDNYQDLYPLTPEWNKDDYFMFDIKIKQGILYNNGSRDPYDSFAEKDMQIDTYYDSTGVYLKWMDLLYQPKNLKLISYDTTKCSFVVMWQVDGVQYFIEYSRIY